jgi:hypothetical protein
MAFYFLVPLPLLMQTLQTKRAKMAEDAQRRVESALSNFVDEIEKSNLRKMQV